MSRFFNAVKRFFSKNKEADEGTKNKDTSTDQGSNGKAEQTPNEVQKVVKGPHPYDEIKVNVDGPKIESDEHHAKNVQVPPKRAPRTYEDVDLPLPDSGGHIEIR